MLRIVVVTTIIIINFVLQSTIWPQLAILGVTPDTALVLVVCYGILRGDIEGAIFGFFVGLTQDLSSGFFIGLFALLGFLIGYFSGKPFKDFFKDNYFLSFIIVVIASIFHQLVLYVTTILITGQLEFFHYARIIILPKIIYTASLSIIIYSILHFINARLERHEERFGSMFKKEKEEI